MLLIGALVVWSWRLQAERPDLYRTSLVALGLVLGQALVGAVVVYSGLQLLATLAHAGLMALLFVALSDGVRLVLPPPKRRERESEARRPMPGMAPGD
jgi:heme A synthase